ncbi:MAG: hypothetical protein IH969_10490, partial [Candidatus Krumholzibacteriota bacterium]|nr:hypothetical protein [Candidatus Krumholzibacteriota bacterium]
RNIKLIPITLCLVAFGTSFGSWGAFSVSHRSQWNRLTGLLDSNGILVSESVQTPTNEVTFEDRKEISAVLDYLVSTHGTDRIAALFGDRWERIDSVGGHNRHEPIRYGGSELVQRITDQMGFTYVSRWEHLSKDGESFSLYLGPNVTVYPLHGADALVQVSMAQEPIEIAGPARTITWDRPRQAFRVSTGADTLWLDAQEWALGVMENFNGTPGYGSISIEQARMEARNERVHVIIYVQNVSGKTVDDGVEIQNLGGMCLVRWEE